MSDESNIMEFARTVIAADESAYPVDVRRLAAGLCSYADPPPRSNREAFAKLRQAVDELIGEVRDDEWRRNNAGDSDKARVALFRAVQDYVLASGGRE